MEQEKGNLKQERVIETYAEDMARVIGDDEGGLVKKIIHEQEMKELEKKNVSPVSQKNKVYIFLSALFLTGAFLTFVFLFLQDKRSSVVVEPQFEPIIFNDRNVFLEVIDLPKEKIIESVLTEVNNTPVKPGGVEGIYIIKNKQIIGLRDFMALIKSNLVLPDPTFVSDNFMTGVVNGKTKDFFILIKMRAFQDIFENMRNWENKMFYDLYSFFDIPVNVATKYLITKDFENGVIENKNARILYDKDGKIVFMYVYANDNSLIITNTVDSVRELISRLSGSQIKK
jgi:hypothetical protein